MARKKREVSETGIYHIMLRGENPLFLSDSDYETFIRILKEKTDLEKVRILAYSLSKNRVHMVMDVKDENVGLVLKPVCTSYARYCNRTRLINGKLFYGRFKSEPVNSKDELTGVISFINFIAEGHKNSKFSSLENPLCSAKEIGITGKQAKSTEFNRLFMEDYDSLSNKELVRYIFAVSGMTPKEFTALSAEKQEEVADKITKDRRILKSKVYEIFGVQKPQVAKPKKTQTKKQKNAQTAKPKKENNERKTIEKPKQEKKDLSVWLL